MCFMLMPGPHCYARQREDCTNPHDEDGGKEEVRKVTGQNPPSEGGSAGGGWEAAGKKGDVTSKRQPIRVGEGERERSAEGGCVFVSLQHQQREEGTINFIEEEKTRVDKEASGKKDEARSCQRGGTSAWR